MSDSPSASSFMMLTEHLYGMFVQYILEGRTRAPPEYKLVELIPTFQFGAKTDRRALQSKFKSWAKRMNYENGCLILLDTGKSIIPKEKCDALIMLLHSEEHNNIENVVSQIRLQYTWSKKNFGMDRDLVVESITRNCKREDCLQTMRMEMARYTRSFCSGGPASLQLSELIPDLEVSTSSSSPCVTWSPTQPMLPMFAPSGIPFRFPNFNTICSMETATLEQNLITTDASEYNLISGIQKKPSEASSSGESPSWNFNITDFSNVKFERPRNINQFRILIEAAKRKPKQFPEILGKAKTLFLSNLDIAPKSICSSKALRKFRVELRHKKFLNKGSTVYRERKVLRDRNKLKNISFNSNSSYLEVDVCKGNSPPHLKKDVNGVKTIKETRYLKLSKNSGKRTRLCEPERNELVSVIDLTSYDDKSQQKNISSNKIAVNKETDTIGSNKNTPYSRSADQQSHAEIRDKETEHFQFFLPIQPPSSAVNFCVFQGNGSNLRPSVMPTGVKHDIPHQMHPFQIPPISRAYVGHASYNGPCNYVFRHINPVAVGIRQVTPSAAQGNAIFTVPNSIIIPQILYPVSVSEQVSNTRLVFVDRNQNQTLFMPPFPRPAFQQIFPKEQSTTYAPNDAGKTSSPEPAVISQQQQDKYKISTGSQVHNQNSSIPIKVTCSAPSIVIQQQQKIAVKARVKNQAAKDLVQVSSSAPSVVSQQQQDNSMIAARKQSNTDRKVGKKENRTKFDVNEEMAKISNWINSMKTKIDTNMFQHNIEKSVPKIISQLNIGIFLVKEARKSLKEVEKDFRKFSVEAE